MGALFQINIKNSLNTLIIKKKSNEIKGACLGYENIYKNDARLPRVPNFR